MLDTDLMEIVDFQHVKPGKGGAFVRTKFKNVLTGRVLEKTYNSGERFEEARLEDQTWQYLYHDGDLYHFMHTETYEQIEISEKLVGNSKIWLKENMNVTLTFHNMNVISMTVPFFVEMVVTFTEPGLQGDRSSAATKPATLESGAVVQVPLFVNEGDKLKVDTRTCEYIERVK
jgi:elongation factor P